MPTPQSSLIIKRYDGFGGNFLDSQYLGHAFDSGKPYVFENSMMKIFSSQSRFTHSKPFLNMLADTKTAGNKEIDSEIYRWSLMGAEERFAYVVENVETATAPGLNNTTFRIKLDIDYYHAPDVLFSDDNEIPLAIVDGPIADGTGFIYTVKVQSDNPTLFLDPKYLTAGARFNKVWTSVASEFDIELLMLVRA